MSSSEKLREKFNLISLEEFDSHIVKTQYPFWDEFVVSVNVASEFTVDRLVRRYLERILGGRFFSVSSPINGRSCDSGCSLVLKDKTTFFCVPEIPDLFLVVGNLGLGFPICAIVLQNEKLVISLQSDPWGFRLEHLDELANIVEFLNWEPAAGEGELVLVTGDANYAHNAWNQLSTLTHLAHSDFATSSVTIASTHDPLGRVEKLFPELENWNKTFVADYDLPRLNLKNQIVVPLGGRHIPLDLRRRVLRHSEEVQWSNSAQKAVAGLSKARSGPVIWLSVRTRNRTATNLAATLAALAVRILEQSSDACVLIDGHSISMDANSNPCHSASDTAIAVQSDSALAEEVIDLVRTSGADVARVFPIIGLTILESIRLAQYASYYFCHHGTIQHKIGWFSSCLGVVHSNSDILADNPTSWVAEQSAIALRPSYLPSELVRDVAQSSHQSLDAQQAALKLGNYQFTDIGAVEEYFYRWLPSNNSKSNSKGDYRVDSQGLLKSIRQALIGLNLRRKLVDSGLFDEFFYASAYRDVQPSGLAPIDHFLQSGMKLGRWPSLEFDPVAYSLAYPDIGGIGRAVEHYLTYGQKEARIVRAPQVSRAQLPDLVAQMRAAPELFSSEYYAAQLNGILGDDVEPIFHQIMYGARNLKPTASGVDWLSYLVANADLRAAEVNPLTHWLLHGKRESRPSPLGGAITQWQARPGERRIDSGHAVICRAILAGNAYFSSTELLNGDKLNIHAAVEGLQARYPSGNKADAIIVTIILPVYGQMPYVLNCLDSLRDHRSKYKFEVLLCDDASPLESSTTELSKIEWITYIRRPVNGGFIECCNYAARRASGQYVVFLNSDTRVVDGWLDELIDTFETQENIGIVGSKLLNADGTLQEAGGIFWANGEAWNYGRGDDPTRAAYGFVRECDYVSGASLAIRRDLWVRLDGFDTSYRPAYCEDADICYRVRELGFAVLLQPESQVIHYEGKTHGTDTSVGIKAYQIRNLEKFRVRYSPELIRHVPPGRSPEVAANWRRDKNRTMLVIDALTPAPDQDAGSVMTCAMISTFRRLGFSIDFFAAHNTRWQGRYTCDLQRQGIYCHYSDELLTISDVIRERQFDYVLIYRYNVANMVLDMIRRFQPHARIIFCDADLHHLRERRQAELLKSERLLAMAELTKVEELKYFALADASIVHTEFERETVNKLLPRPVKNIHVLPWVISTRRDVPDFDARTDLMFLGNFPHIPNVDAVEYFFSEIWPLLKLELPRSAKVLIVGNKPPASFNALRSDRVVVTGYVEDLTPYFDKARIFFAPLRFGAGIKGKLISALAYGLPSIASPIAAEGIGLVDGVHLGVAEAPHDFSKKLSTLYSNRQLWRKYQDAGWSFVHDHFSDDAAARKCLSIVKNADEIWTRRLARTGIKDLEVIMKKNGDLD